jgi:hypothetical protein
MAWPKGRPNTNARKHGRGGDSIGISRGDRERLKLFEAGAFRQRLRLRPEDILRSVGSEHEPELIPDYQGDGVGSVSALRAQKRRRSAVVASD